ncbi:hypothetical protein [Jannaschia sp. 2305UL9-9]|uniref:hypothetical protein n=1 Tax=Jannaschia sp. 2305UL9-9 TaxID=3121638 RepID=UPI003527262C
MTNRRRFLATGLTASLLLGAPRAFANDDGLYEDAFDPQSSFIRVLAPDQAFASIGGTRVTDFDAGLSAYVNVMPSTLSVAFADGATDLDVAPATHYTVIARAGSAPLVLIDDLKMNPAKSDVSLYNLSGQDGVDLFVPAARAVALSAVPMAGAKSVALKAPLTLDFDFRAGEMVLASVPAVELKRRAGVSVVLTGDAGAYSAVAVPNSYLR